MRLSDNPGTSVWFTVRVVRIKLWMSLVTQNRKSPHKPTLLLGNEPRNKLTCGVDD